MDKHERKDAINIALGESLWGLGGGLVASLTVFPLLLEHLGAGLVALGVFAGMARAGFLLTQPIGVFLFAYGQGRKRLILTHHACLSVPCHAILAVGVLVLGRSEELHVAARWLVILVFGVHVLGIGVIVPVWQDWLAGLFSVRSRGRAWGILGGSLAVTMSIGAVVAAKIRHRLDFPFNYSALLAAATVIFALSLLQYSRVSSGHAPEGAPKRHRLGELLTLFAGSLRVKNYRRYLVGRILLAVGLGATGFMAVHFKGDEGGNLSAALVIGLGAFLTLPQAGGSFLLGIIGDHAGHKNGVLLGAVAQGAAILVAFTWQGWAACALCFAFVGLAMAANFVSHTNMVFETCPHDGRVAHITLGNLVIGPFLAAAFPATGWLIAIVGSTTVGIGLCAVPTLLGALWILFMVREPRQIVLT